MSPSEATAVFRDSIALWTADAISSRGVIEAACDVVAAGVAPPQIVAIAGLPFDAGRGDIEDALQGLDVGFPMTPRRNPEALVAAARVMAERCLDGSVAPRELTCWMHTTFGHDENPVLEPFLHLDDSYDIIEYTDRLEADIDAEVMSLAQALVST